jgi:hypothetical protein
MVEIGKTYRVNSPDPDYEGLNGATVQVVAKANEEKVFTVLISDFSPAAGLVALNYPLGLPLLANELEEISDGQPLETKN